MIVTSAPSAYAGSSLAKGNSNQDADTIFENGAVYTVDKDRSWAEAVAVKDGKILYVGDNEGVEAFKGTDTKVIDLKGKMLTPGFTDGHNHAYLMAESLFWLDLTYSDEDPQEAIEDYLKKNPDLEQLRGVGGPISRNSSARGLTPREYLDEVVSDIPAAFISNGHHALYVNSKALEIAGIDKDTPDPPGGVIGRDPETGEPTGVLQEFGAQNLVINALPQSDFTVEQYKEALLEWQKMANEFGITSAFVPIHYTTERLLQAFEGLDNEGKLTVRFDLGLWADENRGTEQVEEFIEMRDKYQGDLFKINTIKIFADGAGKMVWDQEVLEETVAALDKEGFRVYTHAIGNANFSPTSNVLDAYEHAAEVNGKRDSRHAITHVFWVKEEDVSRFRDLEAIPVPQPPWFRGAERENQHRMNSYFEAGIPVASSSDFPSSGDYIREMYPLTGIEVGITRPGTEKASLDDMIDSYTINGANLIFQEDERGSIEVGKKADLVVIENNLFKIPVTEISKTKVLMTYFEGQEVFRHPSLINASFIKTVVGELEEAGEITNHGAARSLQVHLESVYHFENREQAEKVIKHMQGFNILLDNHKKNGLMSERAYNTLKNYADSLNKNWQ